MCWLSLIWKHCCVQLGSADSWEVPKYRERCLHAPMRRYLARNAATRNNNHLPRSRRYSMIRHRRKARSENGRKTRSSQLERTRMPRWSPINPSHSPSMRPTPSSPPNCFGSRASRSKGFGWMKMSERSWPCFQALLPRRRRNWQSPMASFL